MAVLGSTGDSDVLETLGTRVTASVLGRVKGDNVVGFAVILSASSETCVTETAYQSLKTVPCCDGNIPIA